MVKNFSNTVDVEKLGIPKIEADIADLSSKVLPDVTSEDNGKVLKVAEGAWGVGNDNSLPNVSSEDNGKVLKVSEGVWGVGNDNSLPDVTSADEGKIIQVNSNGEWGLANIPAGALIVPATLNTNNLRLSRTSGTWSSIFVDMSNAINHGNGCFVQILLNGTLMYAPCYQTGTNIYCSIKGVVNITAGERWAADIISTIQYSSGSTANSMKANEYKLLPASTASDNGKLLQVVDGVATWVDLDGNNDQF